MLFLTCPLKVSHLLTEVILKNTHNVTLYVEINKIHVLPKNTDLN